MSEEAMTDPTYDELLDIVDAQRKLIESLGRKNQWLMEQMPIRRADLLAALTGKQWKCVARIWDWMGEGTGYADCTPENPHDFCHWAVKP